MINLEALLDMTLPSIEMSIRACALVGQATPITRCVHFTAYESGWGWLQQEALERYSRNKTK